MGRATILIDDFDGKTLNGNIKPIRVTVGNESWDVYLSAKNAQALRKAIDPFVKSADKASGTIKTTRPRTRRPAAPKRDLETIRQWARSEGIEVKDRGRVAQSVIEQYEAAHA